ncbi:hypothetical protein EYZ11_005669 [Aspergillus tanneri]|uniref:Prokaryotic phospholipase A2-domain-containing protein n=1 Tax=Aspergillus tanneri TaxID=1220188 RepID=A0A4S3JJX3_9EURO|nr:uncharacterized protein ATNIH1004_003846 [Aspergillus tanneri]KAA8647964.1 hypothetical protein ATNIH1004_003846 [Aspergillus tanneri]THC94868.1 hypothetical protein EYZ11_005669 [Aspergillus tanneri]
MKNVFVTTLALFAAVSSALPYTTPVDNPISTLQARAKTCSVKATNNLIFKVSMKTFQKARKAKNPSKCNWSSDNCSKSPDKPDGYNFIPSCQRHDFGYRNTKKQKRFTKAMKKRIDDNFKKDLYKYCSQFSGWSSWKGVECRRLADIYYAAVRKFGKREWELEFDDEPKFEKRDDAADDAQPDEFDGFDGSELDADIEGQEIPEVLEDDGADLENLEDIENL